MIAGLPDSRFETLMLSVGMLNSFFTATVARLFKTEY